MSGGRERTYRLFVPPAYDGRTALPLVLELHGSGGTSAGQSRTSGFDDVAAREGFAVASLQADGGRWNVPIRDGRPDDVAYVSDVIDDIAAQLCTDGTRVYATGFSGGGRRRFWDADSTTASPPSLLCPHSGGQRRAPAGPCPS